MLTKTLFAFVCLLNYLLIQASPIAVAVGGPVDLFISAGGSALVNGTYLQLNFTFAALNNYQLLSFGVNLTGLYNVMGVSSFPSMCALANGFMDLNGKLFYFILNLFHPFLLLIIIILSI